MPPILFALLSLSTIIFTAGSLLAYKRQRPDAAVLWLIGAAVSLRCVLIALDPFLHEWDERFHALVAKNMLTDPLRPMLRAAPVLAYDYQTWCCNHIWLHKQPLFLWQMALSLKLFGINEIAVRLPSVLLGSLVLWPVYRLGRLIFSSQAGYYAALLLAFAYYQLELTIGFQSVDHSDVAFMVYVTSSLWAYYESRQMGARVWRWGLLTGVFAGAAVLCKWLPGLVVYAAWGLDILADSNRRKRPTEYVHLLGAGLLTLALVLPWQLYTRQHFPQESTFEQHYAALHFSQVLEGKGGPWYFYAIKNMWYQYQWLVVVLAAGLGLLAQPSFRRRPLLPLLTSCGIIFAFFSLAATKMPSYTYVVAPLLLVLTAAAWATGAQWLRQQFGINWPAAAFSLLVVLVSLRPWSLLKNHVDAVASAERKRERQRRTQHTRVYRQLNALVPTGYVVFNAPALEEVEAMFYSQRNVYSGWPTEPEYQKLRQQGLRVAAFPDPSHQDVRPAYLRGNDVLLVPVALD